MKRNAGKMFIRIFFRSFIIVAVLLLTGVLSYKAAMHYWQPKEEAKVAFQEDTGTEDTVKISEDGISKNLIYCYDEEQGEITKIVLEVFDIESHKLTYLTIPVKTQLTLSTNLYQKLILDDPEIPQVLTLSTITEYLDIDKAYADEVLILEELLGTDINYYTAIPKEIFNTMFKNKYMDQKDQYDKTPMVTFTGDYKKALKTLDSKDVLEDYLQELYPNLKSSLSLEEKLKFLDDYLELSMKDITFKLLPGSNLNSAYVADLEKTSSIIREFSGID